MSVALRVCVLELAARWDSRAAALGAVERLLQEGPQADLVLLPEAALTGYVSPGLSFDLTRFAEPQDGPTDQALAQLAKTFQCHLAGPLIEREGHNVYNACTVFSPQGARVAHYRKRHPWFPETWATPGESAPPLFEVAGAQVTLAICFDVHFLARDARAQLERADLLLFPSAWVDDPGERGDARAQLLPRLAQRFQLAIANANWGAGEPRVAGQGRSRILGEDGAQLALARAPGRLDARVPL